MIFADLLNQFGERKDRLSPYQRSLLVATCQHSPDAVAWFVRQAALGGNPFWSVS